MGVQLLIDRRARDLSGGFIVGRVLPHRTRRMVGPFIFLDHMGPLDLPPGFPKEFDVKPHPHIGLSTVTYLYSGAITHRDSLGSQREIRPGEVNWMTAGRGITHSERLEYARTHGARLEGIQTWVALPDAYEEIAPEFHHYGGDAQLPAYDEDGVAGRLIAGSIEGLTAAVKTYSPLFYIHWIMQPHATRGIGTEYSERAAYVAEGEVEIDGIRVSAGRMAVLELDSPARLTALQPSVVMLLGGEPVGKRYIDWNFVSSSKERLEQAKDDWRHQRMKLPVGDDQEFVPLPR